MPVLRFLPLWLQRFAYSNAMRVLGAFLAVVIVAVLPVLAWLRVFGATQNELPPLPAAVSVDDPQSKLGQECDIVRDANGHAADRVKMAFSCTQAPPPPCRISTLRLRVLSTRKHRSAGHLELQQQRK